MKKQSDCTMTGLVGHALGMTSFNDTFVLEVLEAMKAKEFVDDSPEVEPGEVVIGVMDDMEKALSTLCFKYDEDESRIIARLRDEDKPLLLKEETNLAVELERCRVRFKVAHYLMWDNIRGRLIDFINPEHQILALRTGYKIVHLPNSSDHNSTP